MMTKEYNISNRSDPVEEYLKIGFIQTTVNEKIAWQTPRPRLNMNSIVERKVWQEIKKGFNNFKNHSNRPNIIILPELTLPHGYVHSLVRLSKAIRSVVIAGMDFEKIGGNKVRNRAIVVVPNNWPEEKRTKRAFHFYFGKTFFSKNEKELFGKCGYSHFPDPATYIIDAGVYGNIGLAICSDFFDIERFVIYRGKIHHMIVISHNQDTNSYYFLAEAISRLVYCNVVICNTGYYGDSLAFSPYRDSFKRIIYRHEGNNLFATQVVHLPVKDLDKAQRDQDADGLFKSPPPGYKKD